MKRFSRLSRYFLVALMGLSLALAGCEGDEGDRGPAGPAGQEGPAGPGLSIDEQIASGVLTADDVTPKNLVLDLTQTASYDAATGALTLHFFLTEEDGTTGVDVTKDAYELRFYVAELIPGDDPIPLGAVDPGPVWNQLIAERGTPADPDEPQLPGTLTLVDADTGEYNYLFANTLAATDNVVRITARARWRTNTTDVNNQRVVFANPVNAHYDFLESDPGTRLASSGADMVSTAACESCHGDRIGDVGHGGGYTQVTTCNNCHNLIFMATRTLEGDLAFMIHRIHDAGLFTELGDAEFRAEIPELTYPQNIYTCSKCHDGPDSAVTYMYPTRRNCGSCHEGVDFATGAGHGPGDIGGARPDDGQCYACHDAASIQNDHEPIPDSEFDARNVSEFDVTISMEAPANGQFYEAGETPLVTVTLADLATGTPVAGTVYTTAQDGEAAANLTEGLSTASLYVFGPRNEAVPVLTTGSTTDFVNRAEILGDGIGNDDGTCDPAEAAIPGACANATQAHPLFTGGTDAQVVTDATGFKYELLAIPADLEPGTYMVRFEGADYGAVSDDDYVTSSSGLITFQVGTATEEPKVSGEACLDCHGATIMHLEGAHPHHAPFDTDHCLGCHDLSGNYAEYIGNRVHAVHRGSSTGDLHVTQGLPRDWSEVTFPRPANNCTTCHTNITIVDVLEGEFTGTPVWRVPYMAACGGCHGTDPDAVPADFPTVDPARIETEAGAAQHMITNGGEPSVLAGGTVSLQCLICHGEGRIADTFITHQLIRFRELPVDPNE